MEDNRPVNSKGNRHGEWVIYFQNTDDVWHITNYVNNKLHGYGECWLASNTLSYKDYWNNDELLYGENHGSNRIRFKL